MRYFVATISGLAALALATGYGTYRWAHDERVEQAVANGDALNWLRAEFGLTEEQYASIETLHRSYDKICQDHCRAIQDATRARNALANSDASTAEDKLAAEQQIQELRQICERAITSHVREVAACMSPQQGTRYLALVMPKIADFDHRVAPDVALGHHHH